MRLFGKVLLVLAMCCLGAQVVLASSPEELYEEGVKYAKKKEYDKAIPLFLEAAKQGHADAQLTLGVYYNNGTGLTTNFAKSSYWYRKAAEQGNRGAQLYLAMHYRTGKGVEKSLKDALFWCEKSANQGDISAQHYLGVLYEEQNNYSLAYKWYTLSVKQGHEDAKARLEKLKIKMNPEQISEGERLVKEWFESLSR